MSLTYTQLDSLTTNATFLGRVRQAVASHANYYLNFQGASAATLAWCSECFVGKKCDQMAADMARQLVQDAAVTGSTTGDGSDITDAALQGAVDKICELYHGA